jgi:hypothetical protein
MERFSRQVLGQDGLLLFHFLAHNCGKLVATEVCSRLYHLDKEKDQQSPLSAETTVAVVNKNTEMSV